MRGRTPPAPGGALDGLPERYWLHLRRVRAAGRPDLLVDHVLVGPSGTYVIRHLPPPGMLAPVGRGPSDPATDHAGIACAEDAAAVGELLPPRYRRHVRPVLCLRDAGRVAKEVDGVLVVSLDTLEEVVLAAAPVLSTSEAREVWTALRGGLEDVPPATAASRRPRRAPRVAVAAAAVAAAIAGVLVLDPGVLDVFRVRG